MSYHSPRLLQAGDALEDFACSSADQTNWLLRFSRQSHATGTTRVFVVTESEDNAVVAYYAWCMSSLDLHKVPDRWTKGAGRYAQPVALLARLGVCVGHEGRGLGWGLVQDVLIRAAGLMGEIGCRGLLVHCETAEAREFYLHHVPQFQQSPTESLWLMLLSKDLLRHVG